jgi:type IX secretion system PorP/SprF family membrane protein
MAGLDKGVQINLHYNRQTGDVPGSPVHQSLTVTYGDDKKAGLGLKVLNDKAGLFNQTRIMGSYAYHIPLAADQKLSFGLSLSVLKESLNADEVTGDPYDPAIRYFSDRGLSIDGDFGMAYSIKGLTVQGSIPSLRGVLKNDDYPDDVIRPRFFTAAGYKLTLDNGPGVVFVEPKVCYRGIKGYDNIWDAGVNVGLADNWLNVMSVYHSTQNETFGLGVNYKSKTTMSFMLSFMYTTETAAQKQYGSSEFEIGLKLSL